MKLLAFVIGFVVTSALLLALVVGIGITTSPDTYNFLIIGSDQRGTERARSDVLFLVVIPKRNVDPLFFTIPRDTKIDHSEFGLQKITHFYALGDRPNDGKLLGNLDLTRDVVRDLLDVRIDGTLEVTFQSFEDIIDTLGGATIKGKQFDGAQALTIVRDRFTGSRSDFDRQADAREIFRSLIARLHNPTRMSKLLDYFEEAHDARLQYDKSRLVYFLFGAGIARRGHLEFGAMREEVVPGHGERIYTPAFGKSLYYWVPDEDALRVLLSEYFDPV